MTDFGHDDDRLRLEQELRAAAPQARALFVDEVARRLHAQRFAIRPSRLRMGLALAFSSLMIVALGVLGAPGYIAHAATAVRQAVTGGTVPGPTGSGTVVSSSGSDQYAVAHGICHRTGNATTPWALTIVSATLLDQYAAHGDIIPAPPWGCPPAASRGTRPLATATTVGGPSTVKITTQAIFFITVASNSGVPTGTVSCFDNFNRFIASVPLVSGSASCKLTFTSLGAHSITAVYKTDDVNKWASSAGNVLTVNVTKGTSIVSLQSSGTPAPYGAGVTFTAVISGSAGTLSQSGSVQFYDGSTSLGSPVRLVSGRATLTTSALSAGRHAIRAEYDSDPSYDAAEATYSQVIDEPPAPAEPATSTTDPEPQHKAKPKTETPASASRTAPPRSAGSISVAPSSGAKPATTVAWPPSTFGGSPVVVSASLEAAPHKPGGVQFAAGLAVIEIDAVSDAGRPITTLNDALDIAIPDAPADVAPMYQRGKAPWVVIPRLAGTTLPAGQPDGWYRSGGTLHILTRHLTRFGLAKALTARWGTRRRVQLDWAHRIVVFAAPSIDATATYTLRRGNRVYGHWTRVLPAGKGAPANLWLDGKNVIPGTYHLTIDITAGPQRWTQVVAIRYLR
ncbi:MAG: hypothetical protein HOQ28_07155 [Thermoleophilia bacterium]|nr:hypothetical protein [Thermoleophilia bacterium]